MQTILTNQQKIRTLCERAGITQVKAAQLISEQTMRPCSDRIVRAWLAAPDLRSARPCPDWAVKALEARIAALNLTG